MITSFRRFKKRKPSKLFLLICLGVVIAGIVFLINLNLNINQTGAKLQSKLENLQQQLQEEQARRKELLSKISQAQTEQYLEEVARRELNLSAPGEKVVAFPIIKEKEEEEKEVEKGFWQKIPDWLLEKLKIK